MIPSLFLNNLFVINLKVNLKGIVPENPFGLSSYFKNVIEGKPGERQADEP